MLTYGEVIEIGEKGERLGFWRVAYPEIPHGNLGLRVLGNGWKSLPVAEIEAMAAVAPIIAEEAKKRKGGRPRKGEEKTSGQTAGSSGKRRKRESRDRAAKATGASGRAGLVTLRLQSQERAMKTASKRGTRDK
ncbi:MAG: hypothetical protein Q8S00_12530 [Deltaproteobacteria bacterium]|nr:hypothetical protein [Deltaproteobacteria bacterium]